MIQLLYRKLTQTEIDALNDLQAKVDSKVTFSGKAAKAKSLWNSKGGAVGTAAFGTIREKLTEMCVFTNICNYCEQSEANDIEHIYPKSFFPEHTFDWENYILACKQCNSGHKLDKGYVLNQTEDLVELIRGQEPPFTRIAFINIRTENPETFMLLNPFSHRFELNDNLTKANKNKAKGTLKVLELNDRDTLIAARKSAARHYFEILERLTKILASTNAAELKSLLTPYDDRFDLTLPLQDIKDAIQTSMKEYISTYQHPSVWQTIKLVQSKTHDRWKELFGKIPDALTW